MKVNKEFWMTLFLVIVIIGTVSIMWNDDKDEGACVNAGCTWETYCITPTPAEGGASQDTTKKLCLEEGHTCSC